MFSIILSLLVGWLGLGMVISLGCLAAWWFIPEVPWLTSKARQALLFGGVVVGAYTVGGIHFSVKAITAYQAKLTREINKAIETGDRARTEALKKFDAQKDIQDDGFARD